MLKAVLCAVAAVMVVADHGDAHNLELHASGTTNPSKLYWKYMETLEERLAMPLKMTYRAVGSSTGQKEFLARANAYGAAEIPLSTEQRDSYGEPHFHLPHIVGAISIFHNMPSDKIRGGLNLTAVLLAKIFQRDITTWDHADILAINPGLNVPPSQNIKVVHRVKGSSSTFLTTQYLDSSSEGAWQLGYGSTVSWPADTYSAEGSGGVSDFIQGTDYSIGYVDANHGHTLGLQEIALKNKNGVYLTAKEASLPDSAANAVTPASDGDWSNVNLVDVSGPKTWPMVAFSYMLVPQNLTRMGETGHLLKAYLQFVMSEEGQGMVGEFGFNALPANVLTKNKNAIDTLLVDPAFLPFTFETSTDAINGAGERVFSVKRRQFSDYQTDLNTASLKSMVAQMATMEKNMAKAQLELHGSGTTNPSKLQWKYMSEMEEMMGQPLLMSYRAVGSSTGQAEFLASVNHFGGSEIPLSSAQRSEYGKSLLHIPHVLGTISIFHNVPGVPETGLNLSTDLMARIFQRDITQWDHPDILAVNPGLSVPTGQDIKVVHRVKGSSSTFLTTSYLDIAASGTWKLGHGSTVTWPEDTMGCQGSAGVSKCISDTFFSIGYIDTDHGIVDGLLEVALQNKDGVYITAKQADIGAAAVSAVLPLSHENWENVNLIHQAGPKTWPMTTFSYMLVPQDLTHMGETGALLKAYLQYTMSAAGQAAVTSFGFQPVPQKVVDINLQGIASLKIAQGVEAFSFELSTAAVSGAGTRVFSVKRRQYSDYMIDLLVKQVEDLTAANKQLASDVAALQVHHDEDEKNEEGSCKGRCGKKGLTPSGDSAPCYCDSLCTSKGDCCNDGQVFCPLVVKP